MERELTLRSLSPLVLHADRSGAQFTPCVDYIPGSVLRGAAAAHYLQACGEDNDFHALFVAERASFGDLLPAIGRVPGRLLPATARLCKRHVWNHAASITDALLRLTLAEMTGSLEPVKDATWEYCPELECQKISKRDRASGYATADYQRLQVEKRLLTGTSINRATGTAESGLLFSQEALEEGQFFRGVIRAVGEDAGDLNARLERVLQVGTWLRVGAARSRGLGLVEIVGWGDPFAGPTLESRWLLFNRAVEALWRRYGAEQDGECFSLTLESHLLLRDRVHLPVTQLEGRSDLQGLLGVEGITLKRHVILPAVVRGWNAQQGLPKEDEPAFGRGSALFFRVEPGREAAVYQRLTVIETEGLGRRRTEGFGRVRVCDPFHYDFVLRELQEASRWPR